MKKLLISVLLSFSAMSCFNLKLQEKILNDKYVLIRNYKEEPKLNYNGIELEYSIFTNYDDDISTLKIAKIDEGKLYIKFNDKYQVATFEDGVYISEDKKIVFLIMDSKLIKLSNLEKGIDAKDYILAEY